MWNWYDANEVEIRFRRNQTRCGCWVGGDVDKRRYLASLESVIKCIVVGGKM